MGEKTSFSSNIHRLFTGLAAVITAIGGLVYAFSETGLAEFFLRDPEPTKEPVAEQRQHKAPVAEHRQQETADGWTKIGRHSRGEFFDLRIEAHGDSPAVGRIYQAKSDFRLVQERPLRKEDRSRVTTVGMVHRGDAVEILDLYMATPSRKKAPVWAKVRAVRQKP